MADAIAEALGVVRALVQERGLEAYLVGGAVRDRLLGRPCHDLDLAVSAEALSLARQAADALGGAFYALDEANQVGRTILRTEKGEELTLDFALLRGGGIEEDLNLRDFTIDAMALSLEEGSPLIDPSGGRSDLTSKIVRVVSEEAFRQDPVRLLRAVRLAQELGFVIHPGTEALIRRDATHLPKASGERLRDELAKMLSSSNGAEAMAALWHLGLLRELLPVDENSLARLRYLEKALAGEGPLREMLLGQVRAWAMVPMPGGRPRAVALKLGALLYCRGEVAIDALEHLCLSRAEAALARRVIEGQALLNGVSSLRKPSPLEAYRFFREAKGEGVGLLLAGLAEEAREPLGGKTDALLQLLHCYFAYYGSVISPPQLVDGDCIMKRLGLAPGPKVGQILEAIREAQAAGQVGDRQEALAWAQRLIARFDNAD